MVSQEHEREIREALRAGAAATADDHEAAARRLEAEAELHEATGDKAYADLLRQVVADGRETVIEPLLRAAEE